MQYYLMSIKHDAQLQLMIHKSGLIPDDFILPDLNYIRKRIASASKKGSVDDTVYSLAKFMYKDNGIAGTLPAGFNEELSNNITITSAAFLALALPNLEPSISCVSDLTGKNRNFVAGFAKGLANGHLVDLFGLGRGELIKPTMSGLAFNDIVIMNGAWTATALEHVLRELESGAKDSAIETLEDLEIAFHMAEKAFDRNTLNFKIMEELHKDSTELLVNSRNGKMNIAQDQIKNLIKSLRAMSETKRKARKLNLRPVILAATGEELGNARVYKVK